MAPEADQIGCGRSYDRDNHCVFYTVCIFSSREDRYVVLCRSSQREITDGLCSVLDDHDCEDPCPYGYHHKECDD
jgi:hypothetical protein